MSAPATILPSSAFDFQRDLGRYWRHARRHGEITLTQQGWIYKSSFKTFLAALNTPDAPGDEHANGRLWFMRRLLVAMNELVGGNFDKALSVNAASKLLGMPMAQRVRWSYETWRDSGAWNELMRLPLATSGGDPRRDGPPALAKARLAVLRALSRQAGGQAGEWANPLGAIAQLKRSDYQFLFERRHRSAYSGLFTSPYYGPNNLYGLTFSDVKDEANGWNMVEHGFVINLLTGPLHWMGMVDLGYASPEARGENVAPEAYRLTPAGAWLVAAGPEPQFVETGGRIIAQPNFTILALEPISDAVLNDLDRFTEPQGGERALAYQLTRESLYRGQQSGWDAAKVMQFLELHQGAPAPANVRRTLEEWESSHRRITFHRNRCVVQFSDDEAQAESALALAPLHPHRLGDRFELIERRGATDAVAALRAAGWVPTLQPAGEAAAEGVVRAGDDGDVTFTQLAPSVHALGRLAQFAETAAHVRHADEAMRLGAHPAMRITAASVRAAMSAGITLEQLLATLAELHVGPVPAGLEAKIRDWARFFGQASMQHVTLLELSNLDVLTNLLNDPRVGPYLTPVEGSSTPLAIVDPGHTDEVRAMLLERGISI